MSAKHICLIIPPSPFLLNERVFISLGILRVAAVLRQEGYDVEVLDLCGVKNTDDVLAVYARLLGRNTTFGITATTPQLPSSIKVRNAIRKLLPDSKIILGGPHVTLVHAAYLSEKKKNIAGRATKAIEQLEANFDVSVAGDGEEAIFDALKEGAPKLIDAANPKSNLFLTSSQLSELPFPARDLIDYSSYHHYIGKRDATSLICQLGCPFGCGFCGGRKSAAFRRIRLRSTENVIAEINHIYQTYHTDAFMFQDDELNVNPEMLNLLKALIKLQEKIGIDFVLRGYIKAQLFTEEQAGLMYQSGFRRILVGFETANPRLLKNIQKASTLEENTRCMEIAHKYNLDVKALMSIGHPGESPESVKAVVDWLLEVKPHDFDVTVITPYCGTSYHDDAVPNDKYPGVWTYTVNGDNLHVMDVDYSVVEDYYKGKPDGGYQSYVFTDFISAEDLVKMRDWAEREVRTKLSIPYYDAGEIVQYEYSTDQELPPYILKKN